MMEELTFLFKQFLIYLILEEFKPVIIAKWLTLLLLHILEISSIISTMKSFVLPKHLMVLPMYTLRFHVTNLYILPSHHPIVVLSYLIFGYTICTYPKSILR